MSVQRKMIRTYLDQAEWGTEEFLAQEEKKSRTQDVLQCSQSMRERSQLRLKAAEILNTICLSGMR